VSFLGLPGVEEGRGLLQNVEIVDGSLLHSLSKADALVTITKWDQFRALDIRRLKKSMNNPVNVDLRNIYWPEEMASLGFRYFSIELLQIGIQKRHVHEAQKLPDIFLWPYKLAIPNYPHHPVRLRVSF
jgi:UDP-glucose/GDP-mannose dehydrogenase family, UDP binding domain